MFFSATTLQRCYLFGVVCIIANNHNVRSWIVNEKVFERRADNLNNVNTKRTNIWYILFWSNPVPLLLTYNFTLVYFEFIRDFYSELFLYRKLVKCSQILEGRTLSIIFNKTCFGFISCLLIKGELYQMNIWLARWNKFLSLPIKDCFLKRKKTTPQN